MPTSRAMKVRTRILLAGAAIVLAVPPTAYLALPGIVKGKVEQRYPFVKVGRAEFPFPFDKVRLHDVHVTKPNVQGDFPLIVVTREDESVEVVGGSFEYTMGEHRDAPSGVEKHRITASGLTGIVHREGLTASVEGLDLDDKEVRFHSAHVREPGGAVWAEAGEGIVNRSSFTTTLKTALVHSAALAHFVKELPLVSDVDARDVVVYPKDKWVHAGSVVFAQTTAKQVDVQYQDPRVDVSVDSVTTEHPRAYTGPMTFRGLKTSFNLQTLREGAVMVETAGVKFFIDPKTQGIAGDEECNAWLDALPQEMHVPAMDGLRFKGRLAFEVQIKPEVKLDLRNHCKAICPVPSIEAFKHAFTYTVYDKDNEETVREMGPGTPDWVKLADISPLMPVAVMNLEDPSFRSHRGFVSGALRNSLQEDVEKDKFLRGGSTITMQLAKNVFLKRSKTIGRKVQEALLTIALESCLTKDQIMELYLNAVEFGPDLYGIGPAAKHYFDEDADMLDARQAFFLASILPKPKKAPKPDEKTMARVSNLMKTLVNRGSIDEDMLTQVEWEKL
jgi:hypothetical protein